MGVACAFECRSGLINLWVVIVVLFFGMIIIEVLSPY